MSPDGQMIFFTEDPLVFGEGEFYTIQSMAGLPPLPPGRTVIGQGYNLLATPITLPMTGSVTIQYLSNDVQVAGADEAGLTLYFWTGSQWRELATTRNAYFNMATAASQGPGVYVLMASLQIPLPSAGWNLFAYPLQTAQTVTDGLASIQGNYALVYGYVTTDTVDPWKVYSPNPSVPGWVNDLRLLEFGRGYWISATKPITIHLSSALAVGDLGVPASPPDTYYGQVLAGPGFTPTDGMTVVAWINGKACGQGTTQDIGGQIVYVADVLADDGVANAGCGQAGRKITFYVNGRPMTPTAVWDNSQLNELALGPALLYLPLIRR